MNFRNLDEDFRAMLFTVAVVLVSVAGFVLAAGDLRPGQAAIIDGGAGGKETPAGTATALAQALLTSTSDASPTPQAVITEPTGAAVTTKVATPVVTSITSATPSVATQIMTSAPTATLTFTPTIMPTATITPVPPTLTPTPTFTPVPPPTPTPTPAPMTLREDLPRLSLQDWPRPAGDNGWGMHFVINSYPSEAEIDLNIQRMLDMHMKWAVVLYGDEIQLKKLAPRFRDAGITVIWRKMLRPYEFYYEWGRDINILQDLGVQPYMQIYNEPSVSQEWPDGGPANEQVFLENLISASEAVYNAGGYVGWQFVSENWLRDAIAEVKRRDGEALFGRMFFVPHSYGMNHPPDYTEDINTVLSFRIFADIFGKEIGFVPPMIVGEGGWKYGATDDGRYPKVNDDLHRDYYVALYSWFKTGVLSNGEPLPDYLFAFCPWLIAHSMDDNAFYDSFAGNRTITIEAIKAIPQFERKFTWQ